MSERLKSRIKNEELRGAWRMLCGSVLYHAVRRVSKVGNNHRTSKRIAKLEACDLLDCGWFAGSQGVVTFEAACECLGYDPEVFREKLQRLILEGRAEWLADTLDKSMRT